MSGTVHAATRTWTGLGLTNNWSDAGNWSGGVIPGAADTATFDATGSKNATINGVVNVAGISIGAGYTGTIAQSPGIAVTVGASGFSQAGATFAGGTAAITVNGPFTLTGGSFAATSGTLSVSGNFTDNGGAFNAAGGTTSFGGGAATLTVSTSDTFNNLTFAAGTKTVAAGTTLTVSGSTTLTTGNLNGTGTLAAQGSISEASTYTGGTATLLVNGAGAQTLTGAATTAAGALPLFVINKPSGSLTLAGTIRTANNWTYSAGTLDPGTSTVVFAGGTVRAAAMSFYDVMANGGTTTLGAAMVIAHDLTVSAGIFTTSASGYGLTVGGSLTVGGTFRENGSPVAIQGDVTNNGTIVPGTSTLTLNGSAGQSIGGTVASPAFNLIVNDPAGVTLLANLTVTGTLTLTSGQLSLGAHVLTTSNAIAGALTNLVAGATSSLTVTGAGAGISLPSTISQLSALTLNNASGLALQADLTISGTLTLTAGRLDAGANTVVIRAGGTVVRTGGWVVGRLQKHAVAGSNIGLAFEIGDAARYTPVDIAFGTVTTPGELIASTTSGDHPDLANSGLAPNRSVNRFWTVTNNSIIFDTYDATFTFVAADIDPGADPTVFIAAKRDGATWTGPIIGMRTALSTRATGMASFSDFAVGEPMADLGVAVSDGLSSVTAGDGLTHGYTITVSNAGPADATGATLSDSWPSGFVEGIISPSQGTCAPVGGGPDFGCSLGTIPAGGSATVSVAYTVPASTAGGPRTDTVSVTSPLSDPAGADNSATDTTTVVRSRPDPKPTPTLTATKLVFNVQPGTSTAAQPFPTQPVVAITDAGGNVVTTGAFSTKTVELALGLNPGVGVLTCSGGLSKAAVAGIATFAGCAISRAGNGFTLVASASGLTSATSSPVNVLAGGTLTVTNSASLITWASEITITVRFDQSGANRTIQLQRSGDGVNWTRIVSLTTNPSGIAMYQYTPATNQYYRSVFAGAPDLDAVTSNVARTVVRQLTVLRSKYRGLIVPLVRGTTLTFTSTVRPARRELPRATVRFAFYRLVASGLWQPYAQRDVVTDSLGRATTSWKFPAAGQWSVRSQARPTPDNAKSVWSAMQQFSVR